MVLTGDCVTSVQVSEAKKKRAASKKAKTPGAAAPKAETASTNENNTPTNGVQEISHGIADLDVANDRSCTSILTSHPQSRDIHLESFTLLFHGHELLTDSSLELNFGRCAQKYSGHAYSRHALEPHVKHHY